MTSDPHDPPEPSTEGYPDEPVIRPPLTPEEDGASRELGLLLVCLGPEGLIPPDVPREELERVWEIYRGLLNHRRYSDVYARLALARERLHVARECVKIQEDSILFGIDILSMSAQKDYIVSELATRSVYKDRESIRDEKRKGWYLAGKTNTAPIPSSSASLRALVARLSHEVALANRALHADSFTGKVQPWAHYERSHWFTILTTAKRRVMLGLERMVTVAERDLNVLLGSVAPEDPSYEEHLLQLAARVSEMAGPSKTGKPMAEGAFVDRIAARVQMDGKDVRTHLRELPLHPETGQNLYPTGELPGKITGLLDVLREVRSDLKSWDDPRDGTL